MNPPEVRLRRRLSHDVRGCVASLRIAVQASLDNPEIFSHLAPSMLTEINNLDRRLHQVSLMARSHAPDRESVNFGGLVRQWLDEQGFQAGQVQLESLQIHVDTDLWLAALEEVWRNAQAYAGGITRVRLAEEDGRPVLTVEDAGPGWPDGLRDWLYAPQLTLWKNNVALGLALALEVARGHQGELDLSAAPGGGARVRMVLG